MVAVTIAHRGGAVLHEATPVPHHHWEEGARQTEGNIAAVVTPTAVAGVADMSETERGRESLGAGTPSQNTQHLQVEVGNSHKINVEDTFDQF